MSGTAAEAPTSTQTLAELLDDGLFVDGDWVESKDQDPNGEVRLIQLADVGDGAFRDRSSRFLTMAKAKELRCTFLQPGDILVARMPEPLGRACIFPGVEGPAITAVDVCILRPNPDRARPEWLAGAINSPDFRTSMQEFVRGTTRQRISRTNLGTLTLTVPSVETQLELSSVLNGIELKRGSAAGHVAAARLGVDRFGQAVLAAVCSGRLTADWREEWGLPDWETERAADVCLKVQSGTTPKSWHAGPGGVPFLKVYNIVDQRLDFDYRPQFIAPELHRGAMARATAMPGDVLMNIVGPPLGKVAIVSDQYSEWSINQALTLFRPSQRVSTDWLYIFLCSGVSVEEVVDQTRGTVGQINISLSQCRDFQIPVPCREEQVEITQRVGRLLDVSKRLKERIEAAESNITQSSQAVLAKASRGDLLSFASNGNKREV